MSKIISILCFILLLLVVIAKEVKAITDPRTQPNNKIGIHILDETDISDAAKLVNSSGGDWGYVTLVIRTDQRDPIIWQKIFDRLRRSHVIPIVRIASKPYDHSWEKLVYDEIDGWVTFLNSLNWVTENRYVVIGNEPNHAKEWGGEINPEEYSNYLAGISKKLKASSGDFFILNGALDASAPDNGIYM